MMIITLFSSKNVYDKHNIILILIINIIEYVGGNIGDILK